MRTIYIAASSIVALNLTVASFQAGAAQPTPPAPPAVVKPAPTPVVKPAPTPVVNTAPTSVAKPATAPVAAAPQLLTAKDYNVMKAQKAYDLDVARLKGAPKPLTATQQQEAQTAKDKIKVDAVKLLETQRANGKTDATLQPLYQ
jgi:hypothetical protein